MTTPQRTTLGIAAALVIALAALLLPTTFANAQDPPETATTLHPGLNLVGWTAEPTPVAQLFREIPQLKAVWAWDAELDDWIVAARGAPEWLGGLGRLTPGMGLRMQLSGDQPFAWQRSTQPTRGLVKLRTGWNLVAWSGADQTPIDDALKGIGWSLRNVHRWNPITQQWSTWTSPERTAQLIAADNTDQSATDNQTEAVANGDDEAETPTIRRGEALWINVARAVNWLQPTDILPRLIFPGGASDKVQTVVREDLEAVLAFFRTQYGIQADPDFTIYIPKDADAHIQALQANANGEALDVVRERGRWERLAGRASWWSQGGRTDYRLWVKQSKWPEDLSDDEIARGRYHITHEYFHILQRQLSDGWASQWLVEGTADWVEGEHKVLGGERTLDNLRDRELSEIADNTPTLRSTEEENAQWEYTLGWLATDQLTANTAPDFPIEFWRQSTLTEIGPHGRWASTPDWRTVFHRMSGQTMSDFYTDFDAWQQEQAAANPASASPYDGASIRGRVTGDDDAPVAGVFVNAIRVEGETSVGWNQRAETGTDGMFEVRVPQDGDYRLSVDINDDCTRYYSNGQLINDGEQWDDWEEARPITVSQPDVTGIDIRLPPNVCGEWQIRGRIVGPNAEPLDGIPVSAYQTGSGGQRHSSVSAADGSFAVTVDESGDYRISADLGHGCSVYYRSGAPTTNSNSASPVTVTDVPVGGVLIQVPEDLCRLRVGGFLDGIERFLDGYVSANLCRMTDDGCSSSTSRWLGDDGTFAVATPTSGAYRLTYNLDGCSVYHGPTGVTANAASAALINVDSRDMRVAYRQIPADVCAYEISGALISADSQPLASSYVSACLEVDSGCAAWQGARTDDDGAFAITVPVDGPYRLSFNLNGCTVHFGQGRLTSNRDDAQLIRVAGRNVQLSQRQVPAGLCAHQIGGHLVGSDGAPLSGVYVSLCQLAGDDCATWLGRRTDDDGAFAVTVPSTGSYRLSFALNGCSVYYRLGGPTTTPAEASPISVTEANTPSLSIRVPEGMCAHQITGRIAQADGRPLADIFVSACLEINGDCVSRPGTRTDDVGAFAITVPVEGRYHLQFTLDGCTVYFGSGGLTTAHNERAIVRVEGRSVGPYPRQIPAGMCAYQIAGSVTQADGRPLADSRISACLEVDGDCATLLNRNTDDDGAFAITVPTDGRYHVWFNLEGCRIYFRSGGLTTMFGERGTVRVEGRSVRMNPRQIPADMCAHRISGRFVHVNGAPLSGEWLNVCDAGECRGFRADKNGEFTIRVPADGSYNFLAHLQSEPSCWHHLDGDALGSRNNPVRVSDADVTGITLRLPGTIEELCE